jgi:UDP-N-acetylmuramoyl-L-alanyl-D-glutamate--2,6-diaminopimelate ligase
VSAPPTVRDLASVLRADGLLTEVVGREDAAVLGVAQDSRAVAPGDVFVAWRGSAVDAHDFVGAAVEAGAVAAVVERPLPGIDVPQLVVRDGRRAAALVADRVLGTPSADLHFAAVTGTNGKTTTAWMLRHLLAGMGPSAALGTLGVIGPDGVREGSAALTTPGPVALSETLARLRDEGVEWLTLEASSHALDQGRLAALAFDVAVYTNLSQDHLDYHGTLEAYRDAKLLLVDQVGPEGAVVVNAADPAWAAIRHPRLIRYAVEGLGEAGPAGGAATADLVASSVHIDAGGSAFTVAWAGEQRRVHLPLPGGFNVENALAALGAALSAGVALDDAVERLASVPQVPGRMEVVVREPFTVLIDFAHTPDALDSLLSGVRALSDGTLRVLFGAGGDRDRTKRPRMGAAVARYADRIWLTSDNPRTEDPERILDDIAEGLGGAEHVREADRVRAIRGIVAEARRGDVVVLAGKGHEVVQVVGAERRPLDEREVVAEAMRLRGAA